MVNTTKRNKARFKIFSHKKKLRKLVKRQFNINSVGNRLDLLIHQIKDSIDIHPNDYGDKSR